MSLQLRAILVTPDLSQQEQNPMRFIITTKKTDTGNQRYYDDKLNKFKTTYRCFSSRSNATSLDLENQITLGSTRCPHWLPCAVKIGKTHPSKTCSIDTREKQHCFINRQT